LRYLREERGLREATIYHYVHRLHGFADFLKRSGVTSLTALSPALLAAFVVDTAPRLARTGKRDLCGVIRVFLRYCNRQQVIRKDLSGAVEMPQVYRLADVPRSITWEEVRRMLEAVDRRTARGRRDYAMLLLLVTYGLRAHEVAKLTLDDALCRVPDYSGCVEFRADWPVDLSVLCAADVTRFVRRRAMTIQSKRIQLMTTALRSFLRFARYRGDIDKDLAACVPAVANWTLSTIPRALPPEQVKQVLASIDRKTPVGRRDYAILLTLARLGLRAGEIRALTLEDLDWQEGLMTVRGKAGRYSQLPLPDDVGAAIADYLRHGRPTANSRLVFLRVKAPVGGFKGPSGVGSLVKHTLARAGINASRKGAHQFRHALACQMLRQGASLSEIGELLRHRSPQTTAIYAKVDMASLATLALPWPGGAQ
jgi:site-specific recombinase XerD